MTLGFAYELDKDGDLVLGALPGGGVVFKTIEGFDAVIQSIRLRILTARGEDPLRPAFGLPREDIIGPLNDVFLANVFRSELHKDNRILSVDNITVDLVDRANRIVEVLIELTMKSGETLTVQEAFPL